MIIPPRLQPGSKIRIVSPAGAIDKKHVMPAAEWLQNEGFEVMLGKHVFARHHRFGGTDEQRLADLQEAFNDPKCAAIICSRGGYGTIRIIDQLNFNSFLEYPKWLIGFSDITILHACLGNFAVPSIHGVMPRYFLNEEGKPTESLRSLMQLLTTQVADYQLTAHPLNRIGKTEAELVGGNLSILTSLQGTIYEAETEGKILFLEDTGEYLYRTDRMIHQLKLSGKLDLLAGLVIGDFSDIQENTVPFGQSVEEIIREAVEDFNYPVCFGMPAGHDKRNLALLFGSKWELDVKEHGTKLRTLNLDL